MIEVKNIDEMIDKFPMYSNVLLPKDIAEIIDNAYVSLLVYRSIKNDTKSMPFNEDVVFIEDSPSVMKYFENIFYEQGKRAMVCSSIDGVIRSTNQINPKMFFIDMSAIVEHQNLLDLIDNFPEAKIILISGIANYIHCLVKEMQKLRANIELDYVLSRNSEVIFAKIEKINNE